MSDSDRDYQAVLRREGVVVIPTPLTDPARRSEAQQGFLQHVRDSPEFRDPLQTADWRPSLGGFAALANPSSFHGEWPRLMREQLTAVVLESDVLPIDGRLLEKPFDRLMYRLPGEKPTAESMHRDEAATAVAGDDIFGGWCNLNDVPQYLSCAPRTHTEVGGQNRGFAKIASKEEQGRYKPLFRRVDIPPGCVVIFYERLVHEVLSTANDHIVLRVHLGWRVTDATEPLFGTGMTLGWINDQGVPKIKSGQDPPVWPSCYSNFPRNFQKLTDWTRRTYVDQCLYTQTVGGTGAYAGTKWVRVKAKMLSLREYSLPLHRTYDDDETALLFPRRRWNLRTFDSTNARVAFDAPTPDDWRAYRLSKRKVKSGAIAQRPKPGRV